MYNKKMKNLSGSASLTFATSHFSFCIFLPLQLIFALKLTMSTVARLWMFLKKWKNVARRDHFDLRAKRKRLLRGMRSRKRRVEGLTRLRAGGLGRCVLLTAETASDC
jgi:hypothetical protein